VQKIIRVKPVSSWIMSTTVNYCFWYIDAIVTWNMKHHRLTRTIFEFVFLLCMLIYLSILFMQQIRSRYLRLLNLYCWSSYSYWYFDIYIFILRSAKLYMIHYYSISQYEASFNDLIKAISHLLLRLIMIDYNMISPIAICQL